MHPLLLRIQELKTELTEQLDHAKNPEKIELVRIAFIGRKGSISDLSDQLKQLELEDRRVVGPALQELKNYAQNAITDALKKSESASYAHASVLHNSFDVTMSLYQTLKGSLSPLSIVTYELQSIFASMGFTIVDGPEIETDWYNFEALNIPEYHPARDAHDTFWLKNISNYLLRTHTSTMQIRFMKSNQPPIALFCAGRTFRNEATDASHDFQFMQGEVLIVDKDVSMANLIDIAETFLQAFFNNNDIKIRLRPSYFPFVEPGVEIDASCPFCKNGCPICKKSGWIEISGAGIVHPHVLKSVNINAETYSGLAFGFGLSRLAMLKYGITDVRFLQTNKKTILDQFNFIP